MYNVGDIVEVQEINENGVLVTRQYKIVSLETSGDNTIINYERILN